jgi:hypothetical protein
MSMLIARFQDLCVCQGFKVPGPPRLSRFRGSRTSAYVKVLRFQDLCVCQGFEVPGPPPRMSRFEVPGPPRMSRFRGSRTSAYVKVLRFQDLCICQGVEVAYVYVLAPCLPGAWGVHSSRCTNRDIQKHPHVEPHNEPPTCTLAGGHFRWTHGSPTRMPSAFSSTTCPGASTTTTPALART